MDRPLVSRARYDGKTAFDDDVLAFIRLHPMLLNPLITNRKRRALGDECHDGETSSMLK
jgi:hypothetical protein